jgi:replicative DNA helicase
MMEQFNQHQLPPYSEEAEKAVLGSAILEPSVIDKIAERLKPGDFYRQAHQRLFQVIGEMRENKKPIDLVSLTEELHTRKLLDEVGGVTYLNELSNSVPTTANADFYAKIIEEKAIRRVLIAKANQMAAQAAQEANIEEVITSAQEGLQNIQERSVSKEGRILDIKDMALAEFELIEKQAMNPGISGIPTGFPDVDKMINGLNPSELFILAGRPAMGKTAFALNLATNVAMNEKKTAVIFSLEMPVGQLLRRMFSAYGNIDSTVIRTGNLNGEDWEKLTMATSAISEAPIKLIDRAYTLSEIRSDARKLKREYGELGVIVIDYLQLIGVEGNFPTTNERIGHISRSLKLLARELDVPIIALSQLSRAVEQRQDKRPMMSDLRDSGSIEQDADVVAFLYRDDYYNEDSDKKNIAELIISKQRNGPVGKVELLFLKNYNKFLPINVN